MKLESEIPVLKEKLIKRLKNPSIGDDIEFSNLKNGVGSF